MNGDERLFQMVTLERTLFVEGRSRDRRTGEFAGIVLALGWWSGAEEPGGRRPWAEATPPALMYLVSDRGKPAPIWVAAAEITGQDWIAALGADGDVSPDASLTEPGGEVGS